MMLKKETFLNSDKPEFEACRRQLRSGPASSLRVNIRAVSFLKLVQKKHSILFCFDNNMLNSQTLFLRLLSTLQMMVFLKLRLMMLINV